MNAHQNPSRLGVFKLLFPPPGKLLLTGSQAWFLPIVLISAYVVTSSKRPLTTHAHSFSLTQLHVCMVALITEGNGIIYFITS